MQSFTRSKRYGSRADRIAALSERNSTKLHAEMLEPRMLLAQTTGLFYDQPEAADGYVLFSPNTSDTTFLIDKQGNVVNSWQSDYLPGLVGHLLPDGSLIRDGSPHGQSGNGFINAAGAGGLFERFDWAGNKIWEYAYDSPQHLAHHDFETMPNGNLLIIAWEYRSEAEATQAGRDPNLPGAGYLYPDTIVEVQPDYVNGGGTVVWQWKVWDHLVQEFDPTKDNYYGATGVETNPQLININYVTSSSEGGGQAEDWTHANGIDYNPELDQIVLSSREFSEVWIIDHSTTTAQAAGHTGGRYGKGGDLLYRWGNPQTYDRGTEADRKLFYQHDPRWIPAGEPDAGDITVFNNGLARPGTDHSGVEEFTPPILSSGKYQLTPGAAYGPAASTWTYDGPVDNFSAIIGGAFRLPNGNTLITYGTKGNLTEVTPDGEEVWKYVNPFAGDQMLGPEDLIPPLGINDPLLGTLLVNFVFQAEFYAPNEIEPLIPKVMGRQLFYNHSKFDGDNAAIDAQDDSAIATDKAAYLAGEGLSTFSNVSAYSRGINGVMIDVSHAPGPISAADFAFRIGSNNDLASWSTAPAPAAISVRAGAGSGGSDRIVITWPDGAIKNTWLEISLLSTPDTGLAAADTFYFGSRVGDSGLYSASLVAITNILDDLVVRGNPSAMVPVTSIYDYDKSGTVNINDSLVARGNSGLLFMLDLATLATLESPAEQVELDAVAMALTVPIRPQLENSLINVTPRILPEAQLPRKIRPETPDLAETAKANRTALNGATDEQEEPAGAELLAELLAETTAALR